MKQLQLKVILSAIDKVTAPLKKMRDAGGLTAKGLKKTQDRVKQLNKTAGQIDGYRKVSRQLGANSAELVKAQREVTRLAQEMKSSSAPSKELTRSYEQARAATVRLATQNKNLTISQQRQRNALKDAGINTRNLANHQRQLARDLTSANRHLDLQKQKLQQVARQQQAAARAKQSYDKALSVRGQLASTGAVMMGSGIAAGYAGSRFLQPGIGFGEQMSELQAIARLDKNSNDFQMLRKQARDLGASTAFSGSEVGAAQTFLARAGFTPDAIHASMQDVLNLALANKTDLATTADIASNIGGVFKIDPAVEGNMRRIADVLSGTAARANVDLQMLGETMKYLGGVEELGMSLEQAAAMAGIMGNIGIQSSMAGTTTRGMVNRLTKPAAEARAAMEELGLAVSDAQGNMRQLPDILKDINEATRQMGSVDRKEIMQTIFGAEAGSGAAELVAAMENGQLTTLLSELENLKINPGESQKMADIMADNIGGDLKGLRSAWEEIGIAVTDVNDGAIRDLVKSITGVIRAVGQWIQANPELVAKLSKVAAIVTGLAIAGGSLTLALAGILGPLAMLRYGATLLGIKTLPTVIGMIKMLTLGVFKLGAALLMTPIGWIILGITALITAGYFLVKHWDTVKAWIGEFWEGIKAFTANAVGTLVQWFADLWQGAGDLCQAGIAFIKELFSSIANFIGNVLGGIWDAMKTVFGWTPLGLIVNNWDQISAYFSGLPARFTEFGSNLMSGLVEGITGKLSAVKDAVTGAASSAIGWFKDVLGIKSPSTVFAAAGDDTMAGLTLGIQRSQTEPLNQVNQLSKQLAAASFVLGISALPAVAEPITTGNYNAQRTITEQLQPVTIPALQDGQRVITELVNPAQLPPILDAKRTVTEQLQPVTIPALQDGQRTITELVNPAQLAPAPNAQRTITEQLQPATIPALQDGQRVITELVNPAQLPPILDAKRTITEQLQPVTIPALQDGQRVITELVNPAQLAPVPNAQRTITEQLQPATIPALQDGQRVITELVSPAQLTPVSNAQRTITEQLQPVTIPALQDGQRVITELVSPAQLAPVPNAQRTITEQLQPVTIPALQDGQRVITELVSPAQLTPVPNAQRTITEQLQPVTIPALQDGQRVITELVSPAQLAPVPNAQRTITEQLQPANIPALQDGQRVITELVSPAQLTPVSNAQRTITEQLQPVTIPALQDGQRTITELVNPAQLAPMLDAKRVITEELRATKLNAIPDETRTIREQFVPGALANQQQAIKPTSSPFAATADKQPAKAPQAIQVDASISAPITIYAQPGMDASDIARQIAQELDKRERAQKSRLRSALRDLE